MASKSSPSTAAADKGKAKETAATTPGAQNGKAAATSIASTASSTHMHTTGDWTAVWSAERNQYYFWNRKTNTTTWDNPLVGAGASATADAAASPASATASTSASRAEDRTDTQAGPAASSKSPLPGVAASSAADAPREATAADYGGIDPDLAYLDPSLSARTAGAGGSAPYVARFNARTGKFEGDPTKNPERVGDVQRAKRQNQHYFDYDSWQQTLANTQDEQAKKRANGEIDEDEANKRRKPSRKEMEAIRARNKEKKDKKQKGWLLND